MRACVRRRRPLRDARTLRQVNPGGECFAVSYYPGMAAGLVDVAGFGYFPFAGFQNG